ncbi:hypothetical protein SISSUDRAFT_1057221 [Sistotremastrum suecicum HHB10207 ss-3]|uniref:Uncharacterized protein n=1 Tax=Sistotremastrum suecicum HHB10207 ss-3 TaxID=1314776 RepID=A0A166J094_9AGAM|nr:hypothetical protein SISSUDRAFT_1057221 [Sistotremastrum suecicum HHB10207 ss-3]
MTRVKFPTNWRLEETKGGDGVPAIQLSNDDGHQFSVHAISDKVVRVVHQLPDRFPQKYTDGVLWETVHPETLPNVKLNQEADLAELRIGNISVTLDYKKYIRLEWRHAKAQYPTEPFLKDLHTRGYSYETQNGAVYHYVERESILPLEEDEGSEGIDKLRLRSEFVFGLGETSGSIVKNGRRFTMEAKDSLCYGMESGDPLYKITPFYVVYNRSLKLWHGIFYNNLSDSSFDMGAESDAVFGSSRTYKAKCGPLDYYVLIGDGTLPSILTEYMALVSPGPDAASLTLPPLSQFGYLASSLSLAEELDAQVKIIDFVHTCRAEGFAIDSLHLSSGWCQDEVTGDRNFFMWNHRRYPSPEDLGHTLEEELNVKIIANIKPWLLESHPLFPKVDRMPALVLAAKDDTQATEGGHARSMLWSNKLHEHALGSYIDFSSVAAVEWWKRAIHEYLLKNNVTGMWIDNNEYSCLMDDLERFRGETSAWSSRGIPDHVRNRLSWGDGEISMGQAGRGSQTAAMARATYEALMYYIPNERPVIVSRSAVPGMQSYAHGSWSGDNATTWRTLKRSTALTISVGLSLGPGLYGHDVGGFAGAHSPSAELLVRWVQHGIWHTRFVVHSWKSISTTLWMYKGLSIDGQDVTAIIRRAVAWRYRLLPTLYSLYVTHYMRRGWPVLKPFLWYHSDDARTLLLDEEFIFGSHILVAPVLDKGARTRKLYLPGRLNGSSVGVKWCTLDTGHWYSSDTLDGQWLNLDAPLSAVPSLVREGGIFVLGGPCQRSSHDGVASRTAFIFPSPVISSRARATENVWSSGSFNLIEDDGKTNDHTTNGTYTELTLSFEVEEASASEVKIDVAVVHRRYSLPYSVIWFVLPHGDLRQLAGKKDVELVHGTWEDGRPMAGINVDGL